MTRLVVAEHTSVKAAHKRFLIDVWHDSAWINRVIGFIRRNNNDNARSHESQPGATHNELVLPGLRSGVSNEMDQIDDGTPHSGSPYLRYLR